MNRPFSLRSSVRSSLMEKALRRGYCWGGLGVLLLVLGGTFSPPSFLRSWGLPLFLSSMGLIAWGWLPYRRLQRLEILPSTLSIDEANQVLFSIKGRPQFTFSWNCLSNCRYIETNKLYGIGVSFDQTILENLTLYIPAASFKSFHQRSLQYDCDLFFPYFSERAYNLLRDL